MDKNLYVRKKCLRKKTFTDRIRTTIDTGLERGNKYYIIYTRVYYTERVRIAVGTCDGGGGRGRAWDLTRLRFIGRRTTTRAVTAVGKRRT